MLSRDEEKDECLFTTDGSQYGTAFVKISMKVSHQCKNRAFSDPAKPHLAYTSKVGFYALSQRYLIIKVYCCIFHNNKIIQTAQIYIRLMDKENVYTQTITKLCSTTNIDLKKRPLNGHSVGQMYVGLGKRRKRIQIVIKEDRQSQLRKVKIIK